MSNAETPAEHTGGNPATPAGGPLADLPARIRVHALAKLLESHSRDVLAKLAELGESVRSAQSSVTREVALKVAEAFAPGETGETGEAEDTAAEPVAPAQPAETRPPVPEVPVAEAEKPRPRQKTRAHLPVFAAPSPVFLPPEPAEPAAKPARKPADPFAEPPSRPEPEVAEEETEDTTPGTDTGADEDGEDAGSRRRRRRGRRGRGRGKGAEGGDETAETEDDQAEEQPRRKARNGDEKPEADTEEAEDAAESSADAESDADEGEGGSRRRRRRRRRKGSDGEDAAESTDDPPNTVTHVRQAKAEQPERPARDEVRSVRGSTRLEAKRQRRRDGREAGRRRAPILSEAEFLARRESVERTMVVAEHGDSTQIAVLEDGVLVEHFVTQSGSGSIVGNVYLGRVQNVLPSMEAAFIDIGRGRNAVLYAGEVDWDAAGLEGKARKIEQALSTGDSVLVQVTKDPVGHKGARLTTQISLPGRFLVYVPAGGATGISRKLPENERRRLKDILKRIVPEDAGVIIRTASEGIGEEELGRDVDRLKAQWDVIKEKAAAGSGKKGGAPTMLYEEPDLLVKVVRDLFTEDFTKLEIQGNRSWETINGYVSHVAPELTERLKRYTGTGSAFADHRIDEQITKALDRKVWLPSGGYLVIDRTEAMTVIDVNTGKFTGSGGNLEETVTRNNLESAEEIVRQLRLRDIGGIIVIDFIDMVLESNRELVLRRLTECLGRDRTRHQVAEVTSLGLVQMTRKKIGTGLLEAFSTPCEHCKGRGVLVSTEVQRTSGGSAQSHGGGNGNGGGNGGGGEKSSRRSRGRGKGEEAAKEQAEAAKAEVHAVPTPEQRESIASAVAAMANASKAAKEHDHGALNGNGPVPEPAREVADVPATTEADETPVAAEPPAEPAQEVAGTPVTTEADEVPVPQEQEPEVERSSAPEPAEEPVTDVSVPEPAVRSTRRRPRRAASRPAGPPVHASDQSK
ncbi:MULTISPECIES: translation initiation factor IF-2 N-terminal domain-containing protein [unclassified Amycolatopsis]|uniref:translation initiation factor IF-2 N-terminal domain-containing protein n=1 Tax=unclassified Amycolatopsis TaxID=2618356 RepID=UPI00287501B7|nr:MULTISPECIES: translation initiation factor IF-2 N-terminal domain-containing protein [unclassified Amycolatopsis]MDS0136381.1 translation initiation factor IF-2 N-terminal domain-containing protein [Amycolatopsis sp. 505]MDS0145896.1 translation initiation factor IF-2 N-terminal domain-containing protein [Amycolatopsis sp. CM201R]